MQPSQLDPLPSDLPFRFISNTIGRGAFASIKKAVPLNESSPVFAVKLIHKAYAVKKGRITIKQIGTEVTLHSLIGQHPNVIEWFATGEDAVWRWIAMEYAEAGDLFDKIEADVGVPEDIAHLYFRQLVSGISFIHSKGVAHRDLKPENILLSGTGSLKLADFGMATMFEYKGRRKQSSTTCGSPPYIAPEVLACSRTAQQQQQQLQQASPPKYSPDMVDIWSCGVILFVLLVGNTPWDEPVLSTSWEFGEYVKTNGRSSDPLWGRVPSEALSLLRGMMSVDTTRRFGFAQIRQHPWFTRPNKLLAADDRILDPLELATQMLGNLHIDLKAKQAYGSGGGSSSDDFMDIDSSSQPNLRTGAGGVSSASSRASSTQPEPPMLYDSAYDWERTALRATSRFAVASTQPGRHADLASGDGRGARRGAAGYGLREAMAEEPAMSQFSQARGVPVSLTQHARRFQDILPSYSLTRFFSHVPPALLVQMLCAGLHQLHVPVPSAEAAMVAPGSTHNNNNNNSAGDVVARMRVRLVDGRKQGLHGEVLVDWCQMQLGGYGDDGTEQQQSQLLEVRFVKVKGDPLEWRRFFKKMAQLCSDAIYNPDGDNDDGTAGGV